MDPRSGADENGAMMFKPLFSLEVSMKRKAAVITTVVLTCLMSTQGAFPWGSLTHAYITSQIVAEGGSLRGNAIYGSTSPDFANYMFTSPCQNYLMDRTHVDFLRVWKMARGGPAFGPERAAAFGFVAHNEEDYTAHTMSLTLNSAEGYVIQKAAILDRLLSSYGAWAQLGLDGEAYAAVRAEVSHEVIEFAGDLLIAYAHPETGLLLSESAAGSCGAFPEILITAYAGGLVAASNQMAIPLSQPAASSVLTAGELTFRGGMVNYGTLFTGSSQAEVFGNVVVFVRQLAALRGIQINDPNLVAQVLMLGLSVIQGDFAPEIYNTTAFVAGRLAQQKIVPY
jgi:hypothetical protein